MKRIRISVLLCAVLMILAAVQPAFAARAAIAPGRTSLTRAFPFRGDNYQLANKGKVAFYLFPTHNWAMYDSEGTAWQDVLFDTESPVKGKSSAKWLKVTDVGQDFVIDYKPNKTQKLRTSKVTVSGKGYKATVIFKQFGIDRIASAKRSKKTVTLKFSFAKGTEHHMLSIYRYELDSKGDIVEDTLESIVNEPVTSKTYKFKVEKGYQYDYYIGPAVRVKFGEDSYGYNSTATAGGCFNVTSLTGTQEPDWTYDASQD